MSKRKDALLGMDHGTASNRLRKSIIFNLVQKAGMDMCFQCGCMIELASELSIEHKNPWQGSEDPLSAFFDIDNIAFSHLECNVEAGRYNSWRYTVKQTKEERAAKLKEYDQKKYQSLSFHERREKRRERYLRTGH